MLRRPIVLTGMLGFLSFGVLLACTPNVQAPTASIGEGLTHVAPTVAGTPMAATPTAAATLSVSDDPLDLAAKQTAQAIQAQGTQYLSEEYRYYDMVGLIRATLLAATSQVDRATAIAQTQAPTPTVTPLPFVMPRTPTPQAGVVVDPYWLNLYYDGNNPTPEEKAFLDQLYYDCYQRYWEFISFQDGPPGPDFAERLAEYQWTDGENGLYDPARPAFGGQNVPQYSSFQLTVQYVTWLLDQGYYIRQSLIDRNQARLFWGGYLESTNDPHRLNQNNPILRGPEGRTGRYIMIFDVNQQSDGRNPVRFELVGISNGQVVTEFRLDSPNSITICEWDPESRLWKLKWAGQEIYSQWRFETVFGYVGAKLTPEGPWTATVAP